MCEKEIEDTKEYAFFVDSIKINETGNKKYRRVYADNVVRTGFHMECLKDSLSEDFGLFFEETKKRQ